MVLTIFLQEIEKKRLLRSDFLPHQIFGKGEAEILIEAQMVLSETP